MYRCHTRTCATKSVREEAVEGELTPLLEALQLLPDERAYIRKKIESLKTKWQDEAGTQRKTLEMQLGQLADRRGRLTDAFIDGLLDRELFEERKEALFNEKRTIEEKLAALDQDDNTGVDRLADFLGRLDSANTLYKSGMPEEKRELVALLTSDWRVSGKEVEFTPRPEVQLVAERVINCDGGSYRDRPRTWDVLLLQLRAFCKATRRLRKD